jgi:predicted metal-binding protein
MPEPVELLVCTTCRVQDGPASDPRPGTRLLAALGEQVPDGVTMRAVECLSNCSRGCSIVLRGGARRWTYIYGNLAPEQAEIVATGAARYRDAADGLVPWRERPEHFRKNCMARIPPLEET